MTYIFWAACEKLVLTSEILFCVRYLESVRDQIYGMFCRVMHRIVSIYFFLLLLDLFFLPFNINFL